jgi:hypothetical protein
MTPVATMANSIKVAPPRHADRKAYARSAVSNGTRLLGVKVDNRSRWVRRCRDVIAAHTSDLGGIDNCSVAERSIIRRAAVLTVQAEMLEAKFALADGDVPVEDLDIYQRLTNSLRRLLEAVGLERRPRTVEPTLSSYLEEAAE